MNLVQLNYGNDNNVASVIDNMRWENGMVDVEIPEFEIEYDFPDVTEIVKNENSIQRPQRVHHVLGT